MKRFYKSADAGTAPGGYVIRLDGKIMKTPLLHNLILSSQKLAEAIADEWEAQMEQIVPTSMPLTQLANTMIDKPQSHEREAMNDEIVKYGSSDLVCYLASHPDDLMKRHEQHWLPLVSWMKEKFDIELKTVKGIQYITQSDVALKKLQKLAEALNDADFTIVQAVMGVTGSTVMALAFLHGRIDAEGTYQAACIDEIYQLEKWGEDDLARKKLDKIKKELADIEKFRNFVRALSPLPSGEG